MSYLCAWQPALSPLGITISNLRPRIHGKEVILPDKPFISDVLECNLSVTVIHDKTVKIVVYLMYENFLQASTFRLPGRVRFLFEFLPSEPVAHAAIQSYIFKYSIASLVFFNIQESFVSDNFP